MPFRLRTSQLFLTYPQCDVDKQELYDWLLITVDPIELVVAHELHKNGDHHLHVYAKLKQEFDSRDPRCFDFKGFHGNYQGCRSNKRVLTYCTKEEDFVANFDVNAQIVARKHKKKLFYKELIAGNKRPHELVQEDELYLDGYKKFKNDWAQFHLDTWKPKMNKVTGKWYFGDSRLGKSWKALIDAGVNVKDTMGEVYFKPCNKWWDGYTGQKIVMMDEIPKDSGWLLNFLKLWTDDLPCLVEYKGGMIPKAWDTFIVTSNHSIRDIFGNDKDPNNQRDLDALYNRFEEIFIFNKQY